MAFKGDIRVKITPINVSTTSIVLSTYLNTRYLEISMNLNAM